MHHLARKTQSNMLRIICAQTETEQRWTLCGQLAGLWVAELRECWEHGRQVANSAHRVVDLSDVTFIDESGERLLSEMRSSGAKFVAAGVETKHLLKNLIGKGERPLRRVIAPRAPCCEEPQTSRNKTKEEKNEKSV
jgi:hypothetical protein